MKNKIIKKLFAVIFVFCFCCGTALAADDRNVSIPSGENIPTDLIRAGQTVDVGSDVNGDVILAGANVSFSGNAAGDIIIAAGTARVKGNTAGDVRIAGGNITLDGTVDKNVTIVGGTVIIEETSVIKGNLYVAGGDVEIRGHVQGNATVYGSQTLLSGAVQGNADFRSNEVIIRNDARIGGNLTYASSADVTTGQGVVKGNINKVPMENYTGNYVGYKKNADGANTGVMIWQFLSLLIVGFVLFKIFGKQAKAMTVSISKEEVWNRIAYGLISFILNPIIIFITFITIIGLPLALMILFAYVILIIAAMILSPVLLGRLFNGKLKLYAEEDKHLWIDFIFGYVLMQVIGLIPVLGSLVLIFLFLFSFGRITRYVADAIKGNK